MIWGPPTGLRLFFESVYQPLRLRGRASGTTLQYQIALRHWDSYGGSAIIQEIDDLALARFSAWLLADGRKPATANKVLRHLNAILRLAAKRGLIDAAPIVPKVPENPRVPEAFLLDELGRILAAADEEPGTLGLVPSGLWWRSILSACFDTGLRIRALTLVAPGDVLLDTAQIRVQAANQKQHHWQVLKLHPDTVAMCRRFWATDRPAMWPWPFGRETLFRRFRRILDRAGVTTWTGTGCLFHRIRRSTASYFHAAGGDATAQLGHSCRSVTERYLDPRICQTVQAADLLPRPALD